jgi:hypothetical protein
MNDRSYYEARADESYALAQAAKSARAACIHLELSQRYRVLAGQLDQRKLWYR